MKLRVSPSKFIGPHGCPASASVLAMEAKEGAGAVLAKNKQVMLQKVGLNDTDEIVGHFHGLHCDQQCGENNLDVVARTKKENKLSEWFCGDCDVAHRLETASSRVKKNSSFYANIIKANAIINNIFLHSVRKLSTLKAFGSCQWYLKPKTSSQTKFIAHVAASFEALIRCVNGILHLFKQNVSPTNKKGRNNACYTQSCIK